ncbi:LAMI_0A05930g1_1 [Lachancea mirantina]|uniref:Protein RER1 n=1 Tax=Lachancea mirantina TaxID=1230905 RepID=A0A1G4IPZ2_9SACH|nr:LAMI_0A05930g1_1 [Lachancea mirantina]
MNTDLNELAPSVPNQIKALKTVYQSYVDRITPHVKERWASLGLLLALFFLRIIWTHSWYVVCYALAIYLLNQFLAFLTPKFDVSLQQDEENDELEAGERGDEFRPFIRRLPEFKFWYNSVRATVACFVMSFFTFLDLPVFWPILVFYFILLFLLTMRRQIQHMVKYKYVPLDIGKKKYGSKH